MNVIAQLLCDYVDYETFYKLKYDYKLSEKLYWKDKELPNVLEIVKVGHLELTKYLINNMYNKADYKNISELELYGLPINLRHTKYCPLQCIKHAQESRIPIEHYATIFAYHYGHLDIVKYLYIHTGILHFGITNVAIYQNHLHIVKFVCENIPEDFYFKHIASLMEIASFLQKRFDIYMYICSINGRADVDIISSACTDGDLDILVYLHSERRDFIKPYRKGDTMHFYIDIASEKGHFNVVKFLLSVNAYFSNKAIALAGTQKITELLLQNMHMCVD